MVKENEKYFLKGVEISPDMIKIAQKNANDYGLNNRVEYIISDAQNLPFKENSFDAVFTNGSLHEWQNPKQIFNEIHRVLKPDGNYFISDLRRDNSIFIKWFLYIACKPREIRSGLVSSLNAAYIKSEITLVLLESKLNEAVVKINPIGFEIIGRK